MNRFGAGELWDQLGLLHPVSLGHLCDRDNRRSLHRAPQSEPNWEKEKPLKDYETEGAWLEVVTWVRTELKKQAGAHAGGPGL